MLMPLSFQHQKLCTHFAGLFSSGCIKNQLENTRAQAHTKPSKPAQLSQALWGDRTHAEFEKLLGDCNENHGVSFYSQDNVVSIYSNFLLQLRKP